MRKNVLNPPAFNRPYAWSSVVVTPDPPQVGQTARILFPLRNPSQQEMVVERIETKVAVFGMGVTWHTLDPIGPFTLPPASDDVTEAAVEWTPDSPGHRCVRANIFVRDQASPLVVGRNLHVIESGATSYQWNVPFHLGNPKPERAEIVLRVDAGAQFDALMWVAGRRVPADGKILLDAGEEVAAELRLLAYPGRALDAVATVEAWHGAELIDGIQVTVLRPALADIGLANSLGDAAEVLEDALEPALA